MTIQLTGTVINKALKDAARSGVRPGDLIDAGQRGLHLRVTPKGIASWVLACRDKAGRMRSFPLGSWPEMGIAKAREAARALHHRVRVEGADPIDERRKARAKDTSGTSTLAGIIDIYEQQKGATLRSWPEYRKSIGRVFGPLIGRPLADLSVIDLQLAADHYAARAQAALAVRCLRPILKWASAPGRAYVPSALAAISLATGVKRRERALSRDELAALLPVLRADNRPYAAAMRFMLLTLSWRDEVCGAEWREIDWDEGTWTISASRTKNKRQHVVPLSRQAMELLRQGPQGEQSALIFHTSSGGKLGNWDRETKIIQEKSQIGEWNRNDLIRTGATLLLEMDEMPHIIAASLNYAPIRSPFAPNFDYSSYLPQVAEAFARLANTLDEIEYGVPSYK